MTADRLKVLAWAGLVLALTASPARGDDVFETEIRPLLVERCQSCHGPEKQKGSLRLDARAALIEGGDTGPAVVPGDPGESLLIEAVRQTGDLKMPPKGKLPPEAIAALERWIAAGAPWPEAGSPAVATRQETWARHWAFQPVVDPPVPAAPDPDRVRTPVDAFIQAGLDAASIATAPEADRRTLIRRLSYDLTGLPPTIEEVEAFAADPDPDAYEKLVDRLLASKRYGEQWGRLWLDVARYSDTKGYVYAREERFLVQAPAYRDWVVKAFNDDMPYDRFLVAQIAADQQAESDGDPALAAMGFLTVGRRFLGVARDVIDDRIDVVTRGTMGLTVACSRCHDHKFDPIPTADYYSLYGVFMNCTERLARIGEPSLEGAEREAFEAELNKRRDALRDGMAASRATASERARGKVADYLLVQLDMASVPQEGFDVIVGKDDIVPAFARRWETFLAGRAKADDPIFRPWRRLAAIPEADFTAEAPGVLAELSSPGAVGLNARVASAFAAPPATIREAAERYARLFAEVDAEWRAALQASPGATALPDADSEALRRVLHADDSPCVVPDEPIVSTEFFFDTGTIDAMWKLQGDVDRWLIRPAAPPFAVAVVDRDEIAEPHIFRRGNPATLGDQVPRRFLKVVAGPDAKPFTQGGGRLELAKAIVDPSNPLTARVWVNRIWARHFGAGLVRTPSDFGIRAEPPSHPELLDWLASRLVERGWSTKAVHRLILVSSAYRRRSDGPADPESLARAQLTDPENRLLWRTNPHRLTFEEFRDSLLTASGELEDRMGGRAAALFDGPPNRRRTLYGLVDRQFLPEVFRTFDFANPDLHTPTRSETTVAQQALFALNHPFVADRARAIAAKLPKDGPEAAVRALYRRLYQRDPTPEQGAAAVAFIASSSDDASPAPAPETLAWSYGYGPVDPASGPNVKAFTPLPHFDGAGWGGGPSWPDAKLGWARITAEGGHPGDDLARSIFRRWTSPIRGEVAVSSTLVHEKTVGDGVRGWIVHGRQGVIKTATAHGRSEDFSVPSLTVEPGDTIDFVVDVRDILNSDDHLWAPSIRVVRAEPPTATADWSASRDFTRQAVRELGPWEQLAQVLLMSNEFAFVD
ncbi:PSD1 and planctomycete cytochrome C domain-containing protein [Planctomyces sp. SH-PL62]|uniref:PSD1 and planctomycete cytochrome C domain-containing protein n=1 Tax=Planctomyces sp. SH-PL62 TaxID=1636152 RepID=UPI00078E454C|nr:PSD1 and planctomycete cytochrome C domain-containing protein [Planctomyces sp. SH-PL62]AMV37273.1 Planctomycete cytochrome C [Planctomyces sp. SH-PL62]